MASFSLSLLNYVTRMVFSEALRTKDVEAKHELEQAKRELQTKIESMRDDIRNMDSKYEDERKRADEYWHERLEKSWRVGGHKGNTSAAGDDE